ncbi:hypothetical protein [Deinococcus arcticus]|uniref:Uncharacterized protein n=1 Tax=Deinococcus arcticus TaxID=2136176 RepID=A0A2T3W416_9DEIO|nr:hypothetical protein [Deinococcus arcticus]PTA66612.1 hypothetical protein C8263_17065 [Deinococcus arcticus]
MTKRHVLGDEEVSALLMSAGWDVQVNGRVLCPVHGLTPRFSPDRTKVQLAFNAGTRTIIEAGQPLGLRRPPSVQVKGVTLVAFERRDLSDLAVVRRAAALVSGVGERRGVLVVQGGFKDTVGVRVGGLTMTEKRDQGRGPFVIRLEDDPKPRPMSQAGRRMLMGVTVMLSAGPLG